MNESLSLVLVLAVGVLLGAIFFGGLWWTVRMGVSSRCPALWFFCSLMIRMGIVLIGFYLVSGGHWARLLLCLLGFTMGRHIVMRITRTIESDSLTREARHAPQS